MRCKVEGKTSAYDDETPLDSRAATVVTFGIKGEWMVVYDASNGSSLSKLSTDVLTFLLV